MLPSTPLRALAAAARPIRARWAALLLPLTLGACVRSSSHDDGPPVYFESEDNDTAVRADYFGVLRPGDRFTIRGDVSDLPCDPFDPYAYCDPFDGFAFTAGEPVHVEFRLFMDRPGHDFDVCLYDPQLDLTVDCWQSPFDPEVGGVDVFAGGLDFHLVVESYVGTGGYELEVEVFGLHGSGAGAPEAGAAAARPVAARADLGGEPREGADPARFEGYAGLAARAGEEEPGTEHVRRTVDPETGAVTEELLLLDAGGLPPAD